MTHHRTGRSGRNMGFQVTGNILKQQEISRLQDEGRVLKSTIRELKQRVKDLEDRLYEGTSK